MQTSIRSAQNFRPYRKKRSIFLMKYASEGKSRIALPFPVEIYFFSITGLLYTGELLSKTGRTRDESATFFGSGFRCRIAVRWMSLSSQTLVRWRRALCVVECLPSSKSKKDCYLLYQACLEHYLSVIWLCNEATCFIKSSTSFITFLSVQ